MSVVKGDFVCFEEILLLLYVLGFGVYVCGMCVLFDVMLFDELMIEVLVCFLNVFDVLIVMSGDVVDEEDDVEGGDDMLVDVEDVLVEIEVEVLVEVDGVVVDGGEVVSGNDGEEGCVL